MKIIHTSDLHLASPLGARLSESNRRIRRMELVDSLRRIIDRAVIESSDAVIIAGDLFDSENITASEVAAITDAMARARNILFFYLPGNHERDVLIEKCASLPENLKIFGSEWTYFDIGEVTVAGRCSIPTDAFSTLKLDTGRKNIVVLHGSLTDRCDGRDSIGRKDISGQPIDYLALGHYHSYQQERISERTVAVYSGTPEGRGFDEVGKKGYVRILVTDTGVSHGFFPSAKRTLHNINVDITGVTRESEIEDRILCALAIIPECDLVRIQLVGRRDATVRRDILGLTERLSYGRFFLEIFDKTSLMISADDYKNDVSLKGEFIRTVLSEEGLTDEERDGIIELGLRALMGEKL